MSAPAPLVDGYAFPIVSAFPIDTRTAQRATTMPRHHFNN